MTLAHRVMMTLRVAESAGPNENNGIFAWGEGSSGQLGQETSTTNRSSPIQVGSLTTWIKVSAGYRHGVAINSDGTLWAWGLNSSGQLGDGSTTNRSSPIQVGSLTTWSSVVRGWEHTVALQSNGTLWAWGDGTQGQLGQGTSAVNRSSPVQVGSLTTWVTISGGENFIGAIKSDGTMWVWGEAVNGKLAQNNNLTARSSPVQVGSLSTWIDLSLGEDHAVAIRSDGTVWTWGHGAYGQLGQGTSAVNRSSAVQVGSLTTWAAVAAGWRHTLAVNSNGTLWAWGLNSSGQLGDGSTTNRSSPIQVGSLNSWVAVSGGYNHTLAVKSDGTLWAWGNGVSGRVGDSSITSRSSPVQIGSLTTWALPLAGGNHSFGLR